MDQIEEQTPNCDVPALWLEHKTALKNYILKRVRDEDLSNEILQEVLLKVYKFCLSKSGVKNVRSWLYQIAHNTMIIFEENQKMPAQRQKWNLLKKMKTSPSKRLLNISSLYWIFFLKNMLHPYGWQILRA